jgi:hypothetical protein
MQHPPSSNPPQTASSSKDKKLLEQVSDAIRTIQELLGHKACPEIVEGHVLHRRKIITGWITPHSSLTIHCPFDQKQNNKEPQFLADCGIVGQP